MQKNKKVIAPVHPDWRLAGRASVTITRSADFGEQTD
jgi:hypothetical protein